MQICKLLFTKLASRSVEQDLPVRFEYIKTRSFSDESPSLFAIDLLRSGDVDLLIEPLPKNSPYLEEFESVMVCGELLKVFASAENPLSSKKGLVLEDLAESTLLTMAVYQHCPVLMATPFIEAGLDPDRTKTMFIGNLLEIPEYLASLGKNQIIPLQEKFCWSFGFGQDGLGKTVELDIDDERAKVVFWALSRKDDVLEGESCAKKLFAEIIDDYTKVAPDDCIDENGMLWSDVFYLRSK